MFNIGVLRLITFKTGKSVPTQIPRNFSHNSKPHREYDALRIAMKRQRNVIRDRKGWGAYAPRQKRKRDQTGFEGSNEQVLEYEVEKLLKAHIRLNENGAENGGDEVTDLPHSEELPEIFSEIELQVVELSSIGDGLVLSKAGDRVYVVPFSLPGETVLAKVVEHHRDPAYSRTDFLKILKPSSMRDDSGIGCKYFSTCSGCQLQMLPYEKQLDHKKSIIERAYQAFSGLEPTQVPAIEDTIGSPKQYGYRTKLTPHFDGPLSKNGRKYTEVPPIGFSVKGRNKVMDIESCPIATDIVQEGLKRERGRIAKTISKFKNGATVLVRETTERTPRTASDAPDLKHDTNGDISTSGNNKPSPIQDRNRQPYITTLTPTYTEHKTYTSDMNADATEFIDAWTFTQKAGAFFQNNNAILPTFTSYIRTHCLPSPSPNSNPKNPPIKYLLDAYCGSGLFAITLSSLFASTLGIDIAASSIVSARANAAANNLANNCGFIEADAPALFADVPFPADQSLVVIDPPRKGASEDFLKQLLSYGPRRVVYVSCNVHTQARDVGVLVRGIEGGRWRYEVERIRGFDFFPQTGHVEGVAFLDRVEARAVEREV